jgi:uncharacterized protein
MAAKHRLRIFIDTNWWVSATISSKSRKTLYTILKSEKFKIVFTKKLVNEYFDVIGRKKFTGIISLPKAEKFIQLILPRMPEISDSNNLVEIRDPKDIYIVSAIMNQNVDFLITGDEDVLVLKEIAKQKIVTMGWFNNYIEQHF